MKPSYQSIVLLFTVLIQNHCSAVLTLDNENHYNGEDVVFEKTFREKYSLRMKSWMNTSVDPCDDFYEFACGNYGNITQKLESCRKQNVFVDIANVLSNLIDLSLQKHRNLDEKYFEEFLKAKQFYNSCLDAKLWPIKPKEEFLDLIKSIGGFPAIDPNWNALEFDWFNMTAHLSRYGIDGLISEQISQERHPSSLSYMAAKLGFGSDVYLESIASKHNPGYVQNENKMRAILNVYGSSETTADKVIEDVIELWRETLLLDETIQNCNDSVEFSKWNSFFRIAWQGTEFPQTQKCPCPRYFNSLETIMSRHPEAAANYMALKFLYEIHEETQFSKSQRTFCLNLVQNAFPILLSHFYMKDHYNKSAEDDITKIISEVKLSMRNMIETADWLDESTRLEALRKIDTLRTRLGEVVDPRTEIHIDEMKNLNLTDNFAANTLEIFKFKADLIHCGFLHSENMSTRSTVPIKFLNAVQVQAFYHNPDNSINLFAGILHAPVYHPFLPKFLNFGSLGFFVGHEISHGFGSSGSKFDSNLTRRNWWTNKSIQAFQDRMNCFAQHYSEYTTTTTPDIKLNIDGKISQDENVADSGGLRGALSAYRRVFKAAVRSQVEDFEKNEILPGLDMTPDQMFFLSFAQTFCSNNEDDLSQITDTHPLFKYRVVGSLQNFEDFPAVFNCQQGSRMNPNDKCRVW